MAQKILVSLLLFCLGAAGGVWAQAFLIPSLASSSLFEDWGVVKNWTARMLVVNQTERVVVTQNEAERKAVENIQSRVVGVESVRGNSVIRGSALIMTSDGLILTLGALVPPRYEIRLAFEGRDDLVSNVQVLKRDAELGLALLKVEESNLPSLGFEDPRLIRPGLPVLLVGKERADGGFETAAARGIVRSVLPGVVQTDIFESGSMRGAPLVSIRERLVGLGTVDSSTGKVGAISADVLQGFLGL